MDGNSIPIPTTSSHPQTQPTKQWNGKLIVDDKSKIDREFDNAQRQYSKLPSTGVVIIKWISTAILGALLLACLTLSKVSVIALSYKMNSNMTAEFPATPTPPGETIPEVKYKGQLFVMLLIILLVPNVFNLIRGLFSGLFREDIPWPTKKGFALASTVSLLESVGTCLFVFKTSDLNKDNPYLLVLAMHTVFVVPVFTYLLDGLRNSRNVKCLVTIFIIATGLELAGVGLTFYLLFKNTSITTMMYTVVAVLCLSVAWAPLVQRNLLNTPKRYTPPDDQLNDSSSYDPDQTPVMTASTSRTQSYQSEQSTQSNPMKNLARKLEEPRQEIKYMPPTWKLTIYMSSLKLVFTLATSLIFYRYILFESNLQEVKVGLKEFGEAWHWDGINHSGGHYELYYFIANIITGALGYIAGYIACTTCMQRGAFALPLILSTPLSLVLLTGIKSCLFYIPYESVNGISQYTTDACKVSTVDHDLYMFIAAASCLCLAQLLCNGWVLFKSQLLVLLHEVQLFWTPMYNSVLLEQWLMLVRKNEVIDADYKDHTEKIKKSKIVICTTMYREADYEMRQLLESIQRINLADSHDSQDERSFVAHHVFFDGGVKDRKPQEFALQLVSIAETTLDLKAEKFIKTLTPYGMTLSWMLGKGGMKFVVHLKDNFKVKSKKRWSQVMYMSYVMDCLMNRSDEMNTYILTTDADVKFTANSVEALLDLMSRDHSVGAVCARTHPLGRGPLVWYQVFEYAIGHWFQKTAEHVIGSVLCSPGCFSVYRCKALRDILPRYASNIEHAFDFLTMDMGEDRWLCTLMVQSGWRIEYCAAAENSTHCPEQFDEFYKQRRRWVVSTLANIILLLEKWNIVAKLNHRVSFVFLIYQAILLFATLIGPSSVILIVSGGLLYGLDINQTASITIQIVVTIALTLTCLFCSSKTQLNVCKLVSFLYAVVMTATVVGTVVQIIQGPVISDSVPISITTLYLAGMAGIFVVTGILHLQELIYLLHGFWFLLCLPSGYLVLIVYSLCNITDRSWGTREVKAKSVISKERSWQDNLQYFFKHIFLSMNRSMRSEDQEVQMDTFVKSEDECVDGDGKKKYIDVRDWLPDEMKDSAKQFQDAGFDNTMLISGMTNKELKDIGIKGKGKRRRLLENIRRLPDSEILTDVPENVSEWLKNIGLEEYLNVFEKNLIKTAKDMEILKSFGRSQLEKELNIKKQGHIKRFLYAIEKLRNPTEREQKLIAVLKAIDDVSPNKLDERENQFWENLKTRCLLRQSIVFGSEEELKSKLGDLRNAWLLFFAVSNTLWVVLIGTLASRGELLETYGSNPVGLVVLVLFSVIVVIQFLAMIVHRVRTMIHFLAGAPYKTGAPFNRRWAFQDDNKAQNSKKRNSTQPDIQARSRNQCNMETDA